MGNTKFSWQLGKLFLLGKAMWYDQQLQFLWFFFPQQMVEKIKDWWAKTISKPNRKPVQRRAAVWAFSSFVRRCNTWHHKMKKYPQYFSKCTITPRYRLSVALRETSVMEPPWVLHCHWRDRTGYGQEDQWYRSRGWSTNESSLNTHTHSEVYSDVQHTPL